MVLPAQRSASQDMSRAHSSPAENDGDASQPRKRARIGVEGQAVKREDKARRSSAAPQNAHNGDPGPSQDIQDIEMDGEGEEEEEEAPPAPKVQTQPRDKDG